MTHRFTVVMVISMRETTNHDPLCIYRTNSVSRSSRINQAHIINMLENDMYKLQGFIYRGITTCWTIDSVLLPTCWVAKAGEAQVWIITVTMLHSVNCPLIAGTIAEGLELAHRLQPSLISFHLCFPALITRNVCCEKSLLCVCLFLSTDGATLVISPYFKSLYWA